MNYSKPFHARLAEARLALGMKQRDLADATGLTPALISRYESGKSIPRAETISRLAEVLGVDVSFFLESKIDTPQKIFVPFINSYNELDGDDLFEVNLEIIKRTFSDSQDIRAFRNLGNSMSPLINDTDIVLINSRQRRLIDGKVFLISFGQFLSIKRLYLMPDGGYRIVSDNKDEYPPSILKVEEIENSNFKILGSVIWRAGYI